MNPEDAHLRYPLLNDGEWLRHQYLNREKGVDEIKEMIGCPLPVLNWWFTEHDIDIRDNAEYRELYDKDWLRSKYIDDGMTAIEISEELGCAHGTVRDYLSRHGIRKRDEMPKQLSQRQWLRGQYVNRGKSDSEIGELLGVSRSTVRKARNKYDISSDDKKQKYEKLRDEEWLREKWEDELLSPGEIGKLAGGADSGVVRDWLFKHGIL